MRLLLLALALLASSAFAGITLFPDGSDSIGIPDTPYLATCFMRCNRVKGYPVACHVMQRFGPQGSPVDCANQCRYDPEESVLPLPENGAPWRQATAGWCWFVRRLDTQEILYPASHCENYQMLRLTQFGPGDSECWYPELPDEVAFEYVNPFDPPEALWAETLPPLMHAIVVQDEDGDDVEIGPGARHGSYRMRKLAGRRGGRQR